MAEGSYGTPFYQSTMGPIEPGTAANPYKANVRRMKTRKWVEAKTINYDGSGWGDEDDEDEEDEVEEAAVMTAKTVTAAPATAASAPTANTEAAAASEHPPRSATMPPSSGLRALPSMAAAAAASQAPRPPLQVATADQPRQLSPQMQLPWRAPSSPSASNAGSNSSLPRTGTMPPAVGHRWGPQQQPMGPRAQSPAAAAVARRGNMYRQDPQSPSHLPSQMSQMQQMQSHLPSQRPVELPSHHAVELPTQLPSQLSSKLPGQLASPVVRSGTESIRRDRDESVVPAQRAQTVHVAPSVASAPSAPAAPSVPSALSLLPPAIVSSAPPASATPSVPTLEFTQPARLPDIARFSTFAPDLLFQDIQADAPPLPAIPSLPSLASLSSVTAVSTVAATASPTDAAAVKRLSDEVPASVSTATTARDSSATAATSAISATDDVGETSSPKVSQITPTAPLNPHRTSLADIAKITIPLLTSAQRSETSTATSSATPRDSEKLHEEIIRTLGPTALDGKTQTPTQEDDSPSQEPSYLQSVYDEYWTADDNEAPEENMDQPERLETVPEVIPLGIRGEEEGKTGGIEKGSGEKLSGEEKPSGKEKAEPVVEEKGPGETKEPVTSSDSVSTSGLRRRFSWEAGAAAGEAPAEPAAQPAAQPAVQPAVIAPAAAAAVAALLAKSHLSVGPSIPVELDAGGSVVSSASVSGDHLSPIQEGQPAGQSPLTVSPLSDDLPEVVNSEEAERAAQPVPLRSMPNIELDDLAASTDETAAATTTTTATAIATATTTTTTAAVAASRQSMQSARSARSAGLGSAPISASQVPHEGMGKMLTLRQCMAFETHGERMAKLAETRREYGHADSGLQGWLGAMTLAPEYAKAAYVPLWDAPGSPSQAGARANLVQHVNIPSSAQLQHRGKEILAATGKAGKGLFSLRKGFHKKV